MGNSKANKYWEKNVPTNFIRPKDTPNVTRFIKSKYIDKSYVPEDMPPPNIENYKDHPYCMSTSNDSTQKTQEETQNKPSAPKITVLDPPRKTQLVVADFLDFQEDKQSVKLDPQVLTTSSDWAQFETKQGSSIGEKVEISGASWSAFVGEDSTKSQTIDLLDTQPKNDDPFGLDALKDAEPLSSTLASTSRNDVTGDGRQHQEAMDNILKLYDAPRARHEAPLPPNLGLPMGSVNGPPPGLYPTLPEQTRNAFSPGMPLPHPNLYPQSIAVPQMGFQQGYYPPQGANGYYQYFNGQGQK